MSYKYRKFGLRRDRDLADLTNPREALTNLLFSIDENFISEDLYVINGLANMNVRNSDFRQLSGTVREYTPTFAPNSQIPLLPIVTIQDNIDNAKAVLGDPPFLQSGDGPATYFVNSVDLIDQANVSANTTGSDLYSKYTIGPEDFWNTGYFNIGDKVHPTFANTYGMVQWVGYLSNVPYTNQILTTGFLLLEQDPNDDGNWVTLKSIYDIDRDIVATYVSNSNNITTLNVGDDIIHVAEQDQLTFGANTYTVSSVSYNAQTITVRDSSNDLSPLSSTTVTLSNGVLDNVRYDTGYIQLFSKSRFEMVKTRISVWWPEIDPQAFYPEKEFVFYFEGSDMPYTYFYSNFDINSVLTPDSFKYKFLLDNRLGLTTQEMSNNHFETSRSLLIDYDPTETYGNNIINRARNVTIPVPGKIQSVSGNEFDDLEVGDWIAYSYTENANTVHKFAQIQEKESDAVIFTDFAVHTDTGDDASATAVGFKNKGLVGAYLYDASSSTEGNITKLDGNGKDATEAKIDNFAYCYTSSGTPSLAQPHKIIDVSGASSNTATLTLENFLSTTSFPVVSDAYVAVYSHTGLHELSSEADCQGVYGLEITATSLSGSNTMTFNDTSTIRLGDYVQFGTSVPQGTTVSQIVNSTTIQLSNNLVGNVNKSSTVIFIESVQGDPGATNKEFCVLPLNTAPPFLGTDTGLATSETYPDLEVNKLVFRNLYLTDIPSGNIVDVGANTEYTSYFTLESATSSFKVLVK